MVIALISIHGLFRAHDLELGRDADNGGQIIYVMELARTLAASSKVRQVILYTRLIDDPSQVHADYSVIQEQVEPKFQIRRIACGGRKYLKKEDLWPHLDAYVAGVLQDIKENDLRISWFHSHYADAGYVAAELSAYLNIPFAHTGHSLGIHKMQKFLSSGLPMEEIEKAFRMSTRIAAEERVLANAEFVVTSSTNEINDYAVYTNHSMTEFHVVPPGIDHTRFFPYWMDGLTGVKPDENRAWIQHIAREKLDRFFTHPDKPIILTICRPVKKKNIQGLIHAYGTNPELQAIANLAVFAGIREDIAQMPDNEKETLTEILLLMDKYNLYGKLAIPKRHDSAWEVPELYRLCAWKKGVFANVALTEPFGLTVLEASACGLPVVATDHGGPVEILTRCENGLLVNAEDPVSIQTGIRTLLTDQDLWTKCSSKGSSAIREIYNWDNHAESYLQAVSGNLASSQGKGLRNARNPLRHQRLRAANKILVSDIDGTILAPGSEQPFLDELKNFLENRPADMAFVVASGRNLPSIQEVFDMHGLPMPDATISSVGTEIHYNLDAAQKEKTWPIHISWRWNRLQIQNLLDGMPGLRMQVDENQNPFKISYDIDATIYLREALMLRLGKWKEWVSIVTSHDSFLDILPRRASKGKAIKHLCNKWSIPLNQCVVCGDSGNDLDMFNGSTKGIVVGNHSPELESLRGIRNVHFASGIAAQGILEGLQHHGWKN